MPRKKRTITATHKHKDHRSPPEQAFWLRWQQLAPECPQPEEERYFALPREWTFDFCWPEQRVACEVEGGTHGYGRHNRPEGYAEDCRKYNAAQALGWRVMRCTSDMLAENPIEFILVLKGVLGFPAILPDGYDT